MMWSHATHRTFKFLSEKSRAPRFTLLIGLSAFLSTATFTLPVELLVVSGVLMNRYRWIGIAIFAAIGSSLASLGLYLAFHHLGWNLLIEWYPDIAASKAWADATRWLSKYGSIALFLLMALPLAAVKTPALAFAGIYRMPVLEVLLAVGLGKLLKYVVYAYIASRFPERFKHLYVAVVPRNALVAGEHGEVERPVSIEGIRKNEVRG
jgi:membrane protein YqaA with SNARE-associated domain